MGFETAAAVAAPEVAALVAPEVAAVAAPEIASFFAPEALSALGMETALVNLPGAATTVGSGAGFLGPIALPSAGTAASSFGPGAPFSSKLGGILGTTGGEKSEFDFHKTLSSLLVGKILADSFKRQLLPPPPVGSIGGPTTAGGSSYRGPTAESATQALIARIAQRRRGR